MNATRHVLGYTRKACTGFAPLLEMISVWKLYKILSIQLFWISDHKGSVRRHTDVMPGQDTFERTTMSAVSSAGSSTDLYQLLQSLNNTTNDPTTASLIAANTSPTDPSDPTDSSSTDATDSTGEAGSGHHKHHHGISPKIESAVTSALQSAPPGSDPNDVVKSAITQALQGGTAAGGSQSGAGGTADGAGSPSSDQSAAFSQLLQSYGINAQQFQQDLQSAVQGGSNGTPDFATLFKSFPPGSAIEATG
jgi:hypothetical protein